jgi:phosphoglycolate phosphatase
MKKIKGIIFDWDNTLVESWPLLLTAMNHTLSNMQMHPVTIEILQQKSILSSKDIFIEFFGDDWQKAREIFHTFVRSKHLEILKPLPNAKDLLDFTKQINMPVAIVSNKNKQILTTEIDYLGWNDYFKTVIGSEEAAKDKPDPAPGILACERMGILPQYIAFIGDTIADWECAKAMDAKAIAIGVQDQDVQLFKSFSNLLELIDFFKKSL